MAWPPGVHPATHPTLAPGEGGTPDPSEGRRFSEGGTSTAKRALAHSRNGRFWWLPRPAMATLQGRGSPNRLEVPDHFGVAEPLDVTMLLHRSSLQLRDLLPLTALVFAAAASGDAVSQGIIERQAAEVAAFVTAALIRLDADLGELPIILGGSILRHGGPLLHQAIRDQLNAPDLLLVIPDRPPIVGALAGVLRCWEARLASSTWPRDSIDPRFSCWGEWERHPGRVTHAGSAPGSVARGRGGALC